MPSNISSTELALTNVAIMKSILRMLPHSSPSVTNPFVRSVHNLKIEDQWQMRFISTHWREAVDAETHLTLRWDAKACSLPAWSGSTCCSIYRSLEFRNQDYRNSDYRYCEYRKNPETGFLRRRFSNDNLPPPRIAACVHRLHLVLYDIPWRSRSVSAVIEKLANHIAPKCHVTVELVERCSAREPLSPTYAFELDWSRLGGNFDFDACFASLRLDRVEIRPSYHLYSEALFGSDEQARTLHFFLSAGLTQLCNVNTFVLNEAVNNSTTGGASDRKWAELQQLSVNVGPIADAECRIGVSVDVLAAFRRSFPAARHFPQLRQLRLLAVRLPIDCRIFSELQLLESFEVSVATKHETEAIRVVRDGCFTLDSPSLRSYQVDPSTHYDHNAAPHSTLLTVGSGLRSLEVRNCGPKILDELRTRARAGSLKQLNSLRLEFGEHIISNDQLERVLETLRRHCPRIKTLAILSRDSLSPTVVGMEIIHNVLPDSVRQCELRGILTPPTVNSCALVMTPKNVVLVFRERIKAWLLDILRSLLDSNLEKLTVFSSSGTIGQQASLIYQSALGDLTAVLAEMDCGFMLDHGVNDRSLVKVAGVEQTPDKDGYGPVKHVFRFLAEYPQWRINRELILELSEERYSKTTRKYSEVYITEPVAQMGYFDWPDE